MITTDTLTDKSYMLSYIPYRLDDGQEPAYTVADMVTYNLQPNTVPTIINYYLGSPDNYVEELIIRNITTNAILDVKVSIDDAETAWLIDASKQMATLGPLDTHVIQFTLNKPVLSIISDRQTLLSSITLTITNRKQNFVTKYSAGELLDKKIIPNTVDIR